MLAFPCRMLAPSRYLIILETIRFCSCPTSSRQGIWARKCVTSNPGDTIAIWGCGPVGQFAMRSAFLLGAERVIAIDRVPERLRDGSQQGGAETINYEE